MRLLAASGTYTALMVCRPPVKAASVALGMETVTALVPSQVPEPIALAALMAPPPEHVALFRALRDRYDLVRMASGAVLVVAGLLVFFDRTYILNGWVNNVTGSL